MLISPLSMFPLFEPSVTSTWTDPYSLFRYLQDHLGRHPTRKCLVKVSENTH